MANGMALWYVSFDIFELEFIGREAFESISTAILFFAVIQFSMKCMEIVLVDILRLTHGHVIHFRITYNVFVDTILI